MQSQIEIIQVMNTDRFDKTGQDWWSFFDIHRRKQVLLFDSFSFSGLTEFTIQDNSKITNILLYIFLKKLISQIIKQQWSQ